MASEDWEEFKVGDLVASGALLVSDGYRMKNEELGSSGIPFVRGGDIGDGWIDTATADHIRDEFIDRVRPKLSQAGDTAFITKGTVGRAGYLRDGQPQVVFAPQVAYWRSLDHKRLEPRFIYYLIKSSAFQAALDADKTHGAMVADYVSISQQHNFRFLFPPVEEQKAIASILGALDDKIELNRRINETLEAIARAIFKDWFVDFGPTRAKMEGRSPYLAADIWSLFPDRLDEDGKPEGWSFRTLGDVAQQTGVTVNPDTLDPETPYIGLEHMPRKSIALSDWDGAGKVTSGKLAFRRGDYLFGKLRPYFHKVGIAPVDGICSTDIVVLNARDRNASAFVLACISQEEFVAFTDRTSDGTKMPRTSWGRMERYGLCLPDESVLEAFNACVEPMLERIVSNIHETRTLGALRDLLLPKLMSGEIRVRDAEKMVGDAT